MKRLLSCEDAAAYIGISTATLKRLIGRGEIFPDSKDPNPSGKGAPMLMFDVEDLDLVREYLYPKPDPAVYLIREEAAEFIHISVFSLNKYNKELAPKYAWVNGKRHVFYPKDNLLALRKRLDAENTPPKGYITPQAFAEKLGVATDTVRKYAELNRLPSFRCKKQRQRYYPERALESIRDQIEFGKQYNEKGGTHKRI